MSRDLTKEMVTTLVILLGIIELIKKSSLSNEQLDILITHCNEIKQK